MIVRFYDETNGGFFDSEPSAAEKFGVLSTPRKPLQDSPTPAGNPMAAITLLRLHHYTGEAEYRDKAEKTLSTFAGIAEQFGIFGATYGIAVAHFLEPQMQIVVIAPENDPAGAELYDAAFSDFNFGKSVLCIAPENVTAANLPPSLAQTIPNLPNLKSGKAFAVLCSGFACQPPVSDAVELKKQISSVAKSV